MKGLIEVIAKALVKKPDEVTVIETERDDAIIYELSVAEDEMSKVIGRQGRIAKAIRSIVKSAGSDCDKKIIVEIK